MISFLAALLSRNALAIAAIAATALHAQRLLALVLIGVVGLVVSLVFVRFSAPDLALTQLLVEIVTVLLLLLALLPPGAFILLGLGLAWRQARQAAAS